MKKFLTVLAMSGALLAACSEDKTAEKNAEDILENATVLTEEETAELEAQIEDSSTEAANTEEEEAETAPTITPEEAAETIASLTETAKEDNVIKNVEVQEEDDVVTAVIELAEDVSEEDEAMFIFNYSLFLDQQYPDKEIKFDVKE